MLWDIQILALLDFIERDNFWKASKMRSKNIFSVFKSQFIDSHEFSITIVIYIVSGFLLQEYRHHKSALNYETLQVAVNE